MNIAIYMYGLVVTGPKKHQGGSAMEKTERRREYKDRLLTLRDLTEMFQCSKDTIYGWIRTKRFPQGLRLGNWKTRRWLESQVWKWVKSQQAEQERNDSSSRNEPSSE
jgi:predicted DNA-binding transcriptional regulator AlpA